MTHSSEPQTGQDDRNKQVRRSDNVADLASARSANDIDRIAAMIDQHRPSETRPAPAQEHGLLRQALAARHLLDISRQVDTTFESSLLSNPGWDILLDLFIQRSERRQVSIISVCIAVHAPTSTALRYIQAMLDSGMIVKARPAEGSQELLIELSDATYSKMQSILA